MKKLLAWMVAVVLIAFSLLIAFAGSGRPPLSGHLLLGWWAFLKRNWSQMTVNWTLILTGILVSVLAIAVAHVLLSGIYRHLQTANGVCPKIGWQFRWTAGLYLAVWLIFAIAFGSAGVFRHATWLKNYPLPWYQQRGYPRHELMSAAQQIEMLINDNSGSPAEAMKALSGERNYIGRRELLLEKFSVLFITNKDGAIAEFLVIPRTRPSLKAGVFAVPRSAGDGYFRPLSMLDQTIRELEADYHR